MSASGWLSAVARQPALHFVAIGVLLFAVDRVVTSPPAEPASEGFSAPTVAPARVEELRSEWLRRAGRPATREQTAALVAAEIDDELLVREARRLGHHLHDPLVRRRLARNMRFAFPDDEREDDALVDDALELGMDRTDLVVRRRLIQILQLQVLDRVRRTPPDAQEMAEYLAANPERFTLPGRVSLTQIYFDPGRRAGDPDAAARAVLGELRANAAGPDHAADYGDPFLHGTRAASLSPLELGKRFGPDFDAALAPLEPGVWQGPVASSFGSHLVWIHDRTAPRLATLDEVGAEVREALLAERGRVALDNELAGLRARYGVADGTAPAPPRGEAPR